MSVSLCKVMCERVDIYLEKQNEKKKKLCYYWKMDYYGKMVIYVYNILLYTVGFEKGEKMAITKWPA